MLKYSNPIKLIRLFGGWFGGHDESLGIFKGDTALFIWGMVENPYVSTWGTLFIAAGECNYFEFKYNKAFRILVEGFCIIYF
ncbi:hypothetical protein ACTHOQ_13825 [Solibacillus silvestris]|uniref:hypothetical protein n=1 Tax=Solibacillus silvestris TaxID=76853 RepID=UPI003F7FC404